MSDLAIKGYLIIGIPLRIFVALFFVWLILAIKLIKKNKFSF